MKQIFLFATVGLTLLIFAACGSDNGATHEHMQGDLGDQMQGSESMGMEEGSMQMTGDNAWVRSEPIDVKVLDADHDGYVYQDGMDWNVIADQEGRCPVCGMTLKKVTVAEAEKNLGDHGIKVENNR